MPLIPEVLLLTGLLVALAVSLDLRRPARTALTPLPVPIAAPVRRRA